MNATPTTVRASWPAKSRQAAAACGILGPILLAIYFGAPAVSGWPYAGASPDELVRFADAHAWLFYAGAWLQVTGTLLSIVFYIALLSAGRAQETFWGYVLLIAAGSVLTLVVVEAAFLVAVPVAAAGGDKATVATGFALSNGIFARVFPLAPASASYVALGAVVLRSAVLPRSFGQAAIALGVAFEAAGLAAVLTNVAVFAAVALSVLQTLWILAAALAFAFGPDTQRVSASN